MKRMSNDLDHYLEVWALSDPQPLATTHTSHVYTVTYEGARVILKLLTEIGTEERQGAIALRYFGGQGAVRLLQVDDHAHLLEYADGEDLTRFVREGADDHATAIIGDVLNQLHQQSNQPMPDTLTPLKRWFHSLFLKASADQSNGLDSIYIRAAMLAEKLLDDPRDVRVLHGDIHHENIRYHPQRGWLAFDPKGLIGERTFDAANTLCNPMNMSELVENEERILRTTGILGDKMRIEQSRVLAFVYIYACLSASWFVEDGGDGNHEVKIAELIEPHIAHLSF
jgi:streptomycin 6-kinase